MTPDTLANEIYTSMIAIAVLGGPILALAAGLGLLLGFLQAVTQIQDQTFPQIVKIATVSAVLIFFGLKLSYPLYDHTLRLFSGFPLMVR
jgi:type III secretion protein S